MEPLELGPHVDPELGVEVGERLVEEQHPGLPAEGGTHRHPLSLPTGERPGLPLQELGQAEDGGRLADPPVNLRLGHPAELQREGHVPVHRHVWVERVALEHHGDVPVPRRQVGDRLAADADVTTGDVLEAGDHPEGGGLPAAGGPHEDHELPILDREVHPGHGGDLAEALLHPAEDDLGHQPATARSFFSASSIAARGAFPPLATSANMVGMMYLAYMLVAVLVIGPG